MSSEVFRGLSHDLKRQWQAWRKPGRHQRLMDYRHSDGEYGLSGFDETKSIFVHIPKAAGISVAKALYGNLAGGHSDLSFYRRVFSFQEYSNYFKFTFVRNPWDRVYSAYSFLKAGGWNDEDQSWANTHLSGVDDFEVFVNEHLANSHIQSHIHFKPQCEFVDARGYLNCGVDFLGYFENIQQDFSAIAARLSKPEQLPHQNKTQRSEHRAHYRELYTSSMIECVAQLYAKDVEAFGYRFDNSNIDQILRDRDSMLVEAGVSLGS